MTHRTNRLFPVVLVLLMALMTIWLDQVSRLGSFGRDLDPNRPEYVSEKVVATRFDRQGQIQQRLIADRMWQFPKQHDMHFANGQIRAYANGTLDYSIDASTGFYNTRSKQAYFERNVRMFKPATGQEPATTLVSSEMSVDTVRRLASSQRPSTMYYGNSVASSTGFTYDYNAGVVNLLSFAKVIYAQ